MLMGERHGNLANIYTCFHKSSWKGRRAALPESLSVGGDKLLLQERQISPPHTVTPSYTHTATITQF